MKKSLKVLLLSGVTLLMVACMDQAEDPVEVSSSSEPTEELISEAEVEESVEEDVSVSESSEDDVESDDASSDATDDSSQATEPDESASDEATEASDDVDSTESEASEDAQSTELDVADEESEDTDEAVDEIEPVVVDMINQDGDSMGTATFEEAANGVILTLELEGLEEGEYGFHIHEYGKATPPTFMDALGHFNPTDANHGIHSEGGPHVGDFPNLIVGKDGKVSIVFVVSNVSLDPQAPYTLRTENGTSLIIHEGADDYETQPIGTAGYGMIGGVIFEPMNEATDATDEDMNDTSDEKNSDEEFSDEADTESSKESSESVSSDDESSNTSSDDEAAESESNSEE